jgi:hypothetical protein
MTENNIERTGVVVAPDKESIKLIKNTKGYNWEIKVVGDILTDEQLNRLKDFDRKLNEFYGGIAE